MSSRSIRHLNQSLPANAMSVAKNGADLGETAYPAQKKVDFRDLALTQVMNYQRSLSSLRYAQYYRDKDRCGAPNPLSHRQRQNREQRQEPHRHARAVDEHL